MGLFEMCKILLEKSLILIFGDVIANQELYKVSITI